jgi:hypothetical protein
MIERPLGTVNNIVYNTTVYENGRYRHYLNIDELIGMVEEIINSHETTSEYIQFNPFYRNSHSESQVEFDDYMFYMECRRDFDAEDIVKHQMENASPKYRIYPIELVDAEALYPLCRIGDAEAFKEGLVGYLRYLDRVLSKLLKIAKSELGLSDDDLAFGYFCFEIHSE